GLYDLRGLHPDGGPCGNDHFAADHHRIIEDALVRHARLRRIDVDRFGEANTEHGAHRHGHWRRRLGRGWRRWGWCLARRELHAGDVLDLEFCDLTVCEQEADGLDVRAHERALHRFARAELHAVG